MSDRIQKAAAMNSLTADDVIAAAVRVCELRGIAPIGEQLDAIVEEVVKHLEVMHGLHSRTTYA